MTVQRNLDRLSAVGCRKANLLYGSINPFAMRQTFTSHGTSREAATAM